MSVRKSYALIYSPLAGNREEMIKHLNDIAEVIHWRAEFSNFFILISEAPATKLSEQIRKRTGDQGKFLVTEIPINKQGWLTPDAWHLINQKQHKRPRKD